MPIWLLRYLPHILGLLGLIAGLWWFGHSRYEAGQADVRAEWDAAIVVAQIEADKKEAADAEVAKAMQDELVRRGGLLDAATARGRTLAGRLRNYQASRCLPQAADPAAGPAPAPGVPGDPAGPGTAVELALDNHLSACERDAERLSGWQRWWGEVGAN